MAFVRRNKGARRIQMTSNPREEEIELEVQRLLEEHRQRQLRNQKRQELADAQRTAVRLTHPEKGEWTEVMPKKYVTQYSRRGANNTLEIKSERLNFEYCRIVGLREAPPERKKKDNKQ
jgi:hypothetical protein